jgi:hypothetical protein
MNFSEEDDSVFGCDASLENPYGTALVKLSVDYREGFGMPHDLSMIDGVFWELTSHQVG